VFRCVIGPIALRWKLENDDVMNVSLSVRCIVTDESSVLMVKHRDHDASNAQGEFWVLPGGGVERGESIMQAAEREVLEETGLSVRAISVVHLREFEWNGGDPPRGRSNIGRSLEVYVRAEIVSGTLQLGHDPELQPDEQVLLDAAWIPIPTLSSILHFPEYLEVMLDPDLEKPLAPRFETLL
jgi:8-oxo-dGTP diphosphatase